MAGEKLTPAQGALWFGCFMVVFIALVLIALALVWAAEFETPF